MRTYEAGQKAIRLKIRPWTSLSTKWAESRFQGPDCDAEARDAERQKRFAVC